MPHIESYILVKPPSKLDVWFKRYQHFSASQNKKIQRKLEVIIGCIFKSILASSDSLNYLITFCVIVIWIVIFRSVNVCTLLNYEPQHLFLNYSILMFSPPISSTHTQKIHLFLSLIFYFCNLI